MNTAEMLAQLNMNGKQTCWLSNLKYQFSTSEKPFVASLRSQNGNAAIS